MAVIDRFRNASPGRQIGLLGIGMALIALLMLIVYFAFLRTDYDLLFGDLSLADAAQMTVELDAQGIPYRIRQDGTAIEVPAGDVEAARLAVMSANLPLESTVGFELFDESNIGLTEFAQQINFQRALQGELTRTIMALDMVEAARVHISLAERTIFRGDRTPPTASVTIVTRPGRTMPPASVEGVQRLVAASVPDLDIDNVVILDQTGRVISSAIVAPVLASPEARERNAVESFYLARIEQALSAYRHDADFTVTVRMIAAAPIDDTAEDDAASAGDWLEGGRGFGLMVTVATDLAGDPAEVEAIRVQVREVIGETPVAADSIAVTAPSAAPAPARPATGVSAPPLVPRSRDTAPGLLTTLGWGALAALGLALLILMIRDRGGGRLTENQRRSLVDQLNRALDQGAADAHA